MLGSFGMCLNEVQFPRELRHQIEEELANGGSPQ